MTEADRPGTFDPKKTEIPVDPTDIYEPSGAAKRDFRTDTTDMPTGQGIQVVINGDKKSVRILVTKPVDTRPFVMNAGKRAGDIVDFEKTGK